MKLVWSLTPGQAGGTPAPPGQDQEPAFVAVAADGTEMAPTWGPNRHSGSDFSSSQEQEWGMAFTLPAEGCWELRASRDAGSASVWLTVAGT